MSQPPDIFPQINQFVYKSVWFCEPAMAWSSLLLVLAFSGWAVLALEGPGYDVRDKHCTWEPLGSGGGEQSVTCKTRIIDFRSKNTSVSSIIQEANKQRSTAQLDIQVREQHFF